MTTIYPPIYLLSTESRCWRCGQQQTVIAVAGSGPQEDLEPIKVHYIREMPGDLLDQVTARQPNYRLHRSRSTNSDYYTNMCECGANYGDFFLHSEPGDGGFFPTMREEAELITIEELLPNPVEVEFKAHSGLSPLIMEYATRKDSGGST